MSSNRFLSKVIVDVFSLCRCVNTHLYVPDQQKAFSFYRGDPVDDQLIDISDQQHLDDTFLYLIL